MILGGDVAVTASTHNGTAWQPLPQLLSPNASLELISTAIKFRASVPDCNSALATLEYRSVAPVSPSVDEIAHVTIVVNDMGNYGCYNDCSTAAPVPLLAVSTIVIVNYGWFSHRWLLLRPGVLLGVATGIGMLLIILASICAWLYLVNRLLSTKGKAKENQQELSCLTAVRTRWERFLTRFSKTEDFGPQELIVPSLGVAAGGMLDDDGPWTHNAIETADDGYTQDEGLAESDSVDIYQTVDSFDGVVEDLAEDNCPASDAIQAIYAADSNGHFNSNTDKGAEDNCPLSNAIRAIYEAESSGLFHSNTAESALEGIGYHCSDGYIIPGDLDAAEQEVSTTNLANEPENTSMTYQINGMSSLVARELNHRAENEGTRHFKYFMVSEAPLVEEQYPELNHRVENEGTHHFKYSMVLEAPLVEERYPERSLSRDREVVMPASVHSSLIDNNFNQQNVEVNQTCEGHSLECYENTGNYQSSELTLEAAERSQNEYINQLDKEMGGIDDVLSSMPFGDSSSSSHSCSSTEEGNTDPGRIMSIEPMIDMHGNLEEDRICEHNGNDTHPPINSHPADLYEEVTSQMPELKLILELPEGSSLEEDIDPLDHINLVFSSLEKDADGSLVAVLSQSM